ncbi:MAG: hypothetical protein E7585_05510 [Ruminococcaceae bacterium]|nr:hypothetical protein [Oscillospiraceae bacterium]
MKKSVKILLGVLIGIICLVLLILLGFKLVDGIRHAAFYRKADGEMKMPGIRDGFVQQGFDYVEGEEAFLVAGYMKGEAASRVYLLRDDGSESYTELKKADGTDYRGHTGGIAHFGDYIYITGSKGLDVFSYQEILAGAKSAKCLGTVETYNDPAYCYTYNGYILVGSFYRPGNYETEAYQRMATPGGDQNRSMMAVFQLDANAAFGIDPVMRAVISTPDQVQGMCINDNGKIVLSTSYGMASSKLLVYDVNKIAEPDVRAFAGTTKDGVDFSFSELPIYYLESSCQTEVIKAPPMSEELVYLDGKIYIMNESASNKYIFGKITTGRKIYAYSYNE